MFSVWRTVSADIASLTSLRTCHLVEKLNCTSERCLLISILTAIKQGARLMETEPFKKLGARLTLPQFSECTQQGPPNLDDPVYMECLVRMSAITMYHPASTCSMGNKDDIRSSVVDPSLR